MKNVMFTDKLKKDSMLHAFAERATPILEEVLGPSAQVVEAVWDRLDDEKGRTLVTLRISDWTGTADAKFAPWEVEQSTRLRLLHLWGDLLAKRSEVYFQN